MVEVGETVAYATQGYVKEKTRQENGTASHKGTKSVKVTFAKQFTKIPKIVVSGGEARNVSVNGFTHYIDTGDNVDFDYVALPREEDL